jgi:hypothetical protein
VLIFGHPFFQSGQVRLPLSTATITTILGNLNTSFKIGTPGTPVGTATQDRRAAVAGRLGPPPALMPLHVVVRGTSAREQRFAFQCIEDRSLLSQLVVRRSSTACSNRAVRPRNRRPSGASRCGAVAADCGWAISPPENPRSTTSRRG